MAIVHADNFNYYGDDEDNLLDGVYAQVTVATIETDPDGLSTPKCLRVGSSSSNTGLRYVLPAAVTTFGVAFRIWMPSLPANTSTGGTTPAIVLKNGSNVGFAMLCVTTTGGIKVVGSGLTPSSTALGETVGPVLTAGGWYHVEWKHTISATVGTTEVRVEGVTVINESNLNTGTTSVAQFDMGRWNSGAGPGTYVYYKDEVVWNGTGSENIDFLGSVLVYELLPTSDSAFPTGWTSTDANGFSVLDNNPPDDATHYISADETPPSPAKFGLTDLPTDITSVKALITRVRAAKSDGGDGSLQVGLISGSDTDTGADRPITTAQTYWSDVSELDPATSAAWTPVAVNAALLQIDRTT